ncbi:hypothetical protein M6B38_129630 [Iris pallida]|uniref:rRNA N-glycosylase n=1 Tax=Iris pallida TaxID=29817 RepID=A0AAX6G635_IRIPA|nr:hypothetical protein M6B38_129630 [Iris pallida]
MYRVNMKAWLVLTWASWAAIVGPATWVCSSSLLVTEGGHNNNLSIDKVEFHVNGCTRKSYSVFLESLRKHLSSGNSAYNIPLLPIPYPPEQDLLFVEIFDWEDKSITLVLSRINSYVIAYKAQDLYYLLYDTPENEEIFGKNRHKFPFTGSYTSLERVAESRENIDLGITELAQAISNLRSWSKKESKSSVAHAFIVLIQMVSETARFRAIEQKVTKNIIDGKGYQSFRPGVGVMDLQNNWGTLSFEVQDSVGGVFLKPVTLKATLTDTVVIRNVKEAREFCGLALLLYRRRKCQA